MKNTDKFLISFVGGVILLIVVVFAIAFLRPKPTYQPEDTPEGVAHNYLLALQQEDFPRAYHYLSPSLKGYPASAEIFAEQIDDNPWEFRNLHDGSVTLAIESSRLTERRAVVSVQETHFRSRGLFNSSQYTNAFEMKLQNENGTWRVVESVSYWMWCWSNEDGCS